MGDPDLEEIRQRRKAELQKQSEHDLAGNGQKNEEAKNREQEMRNSILAQVLNQEARARLNTLMVAKPEKGQMVENLLMNMARSGQLMGKLGEEDLKGLLEKVSEQMQPRQGKVTFDRRRAMLDDDDD